MGFEDDDGDVGLGEAEREEQADGAGADDDYGRGCGCGGGRGGLGRHAVVWWMEGGLRRRTVDLIELGMGDEVVDMYEY